MFLKRIQESQGPKERTQNTEFNVSALKTSSGKLKFKEENKPIIRFEDIISTTVFVLTVLCFYSKRING